MSTMLACSRKLVAGSISFCVLFGPEVSAYTVLQPVASGTLSALLYILFGSEWAKTYGFQLPGSSDLGSVREVASDIPH
eukprot:5084144-Amphidinium_carterae.2